MLASSDPSLSSTSTVLSGSLITASDTGGVGASRGSTIAPRQPAADTTEPGRFRTRHAFIETRKNARLSPPGVAQGEATDPDIDPTDGGAVAEAGKPLRATAAALYLPLSRGVAAEQDRRTGPGKRCAKPAAARRLANARTYVYINE